MNMLTLSGFSMRNLVTPKEYTTLTGNNSLLANPIPVRQNQVENETDNGVIKGIVYFRQYEDFGKSCNSHMVLVLGIGRAKPPY